MTFLFFLTIILITILIGFILGYNYYKRRSFFGGFLILDDESGNMHAQFIDEDVIHNNYFITLKVVKMDDVKEEDSE